MKTESAQLSGLLSLSGGFSDDEQDGYEYDRRDHQGAVYVGEGQCLGLFLEHVVDRALGLGDRADRISGNSHEHSLQAVEHAGVGRVVGREVLDEVGLLNLAVALERVGDEGDADACADHAPELHEAGGAVSRFSAHVSVGHGSDRHENNGDPEALQQAREDDGPNVRIQVEVRHLEQGYG